MQATKIPRSLGQTLQSAAGSQAVDACLLIYTEAYALTKRLRQLLLHSTDFEGRSAARKGVKDAIAGLQPLREARADDWAVE